MSYVDEAIRDLAARQACGYREVIPSKVNITPIWALPDASVELERELAEYDEVVNRGVLRGHESGQTSCYLSPMGKRPGFVQALVKRINGANLGMRAESGSPQRDGSWVKISWGEK